MLHNCTIGIGIGIRIGIGIGKNKINGFSRQKDSISTSNALDLSPDDLLTPED